MIDRSCRILLSVILLGVIEIAAAAAGDDFALRMRPCEACHGREGRPASDGYYPRIAGKPAGYLYEQLLNFRDGRRLSPMMNYLVDRQNETYLRKMADYFSQLEFPYATPAAVKRNTATMTQGEQLVRHGDAARKIPACTTCHGERLTGNAPAVPGLLGLPQYYLAAQLSAWQQGRRHARAPDCMAEIAQRLTAADLDAVTAWLAAQAVPVNARAAATKIDPPVRCGSLGPHT